MIYGGIPLTYLRGSLRITLGKNHPIRHFDDSDLNDAVPLGRTSTIITCTLRAMTTEEFITMSQIAHGESAADLQLNGIYFKNVTSGQKAPIRHVVGDCHVCEIEFRAADPVPYNAVTDEPMW